MIPLRVAALGSNLTFIAYGLTLGLTPVRCSASGEHQTRLPISSLFPACRQIGAP